MSKSRFVLPSIRWSDMEKLVNPEERGRFLAFKGKSDSYLRRVQSNPAEPPKIDWEAYKKILPDPSIASKLKSAYEKYKVPMPLDNLSAEVDKQWSELEPKIKEYNDKQDQIIKSAQKEVDRINALPPFDSITMEMFAEMYPNLALDPVRRPSFWPHTPDEQLGYVSPEQQQQKKGH